MISSSTRPDDKLSEQSAQVAGRPARISCIIPTHERDDLLRHAIASVSEQSTVPLELIVSDDTASETTRRLVRECGADLAFPVLYVDASQTGAGTAGASRNTGASNARGDLLAFLDDDDFWQPNYLERMSKLLHVSCADFVVSWTERRLGDRATPGFRMKEGVTFREALQPNPGLTGSNFLIKQSIFTSVGGFDSSLPVSNDTDFVIRLLEAGHHYAVVPEALVVQVGHEGTHLSTRNPRRAPALEAFRAKWGAHMTRPQQRRVSRMVHASQRGSDQPLRARLIHTVLLAWFTSPTAFVRAVKKRVHRQPGMYGK